LTVSALEAGLAPVRLLKVPLPGDLAVRRHFDEVVAVIRQAPLFREEAPGLEGLTEEEAAHELAFTLCFNGFGALSASLESTLAELSLHPLVLDGVREELRAAWDSAGGRPPPLASLMALPRTRNAVREAQRLHPPTPIVFREAQEDFTLVSRTGAYAVKRGELLWGVVEI